jgi:hypothetical protein
MHKNLADNYSDSEVELKKIIFA